MEKLEDVLQAGLDTVVGAPRYVMAYVLKMPIKVYVGRKSMSMGDDVNAPNMFTFRLTDDPDDVVDRMFSRGLPSYTSWTGYLGKPGHSSSDEDGVQVTKRSSDEVLFEIHEGKNGGKPTYEFTKGWYQKIVAHPYIYCE